MAARQLIPRLFIAQAGRGGGFQAARPRAEMPTQAIPNRIPNTRINLALFRQEAMTL